MDYTKIYKNYVEVENFRKGSAMCALNVIRSSSVFKQSHIVRLSTHLCVEVINTHRTLLVAPLTELRNISEKRINECA